MATRKFLTPPKKPKPREVPLKADLVHDRERRERVLSTIKDYYLVYKPSEKIRNMEVRRNILRVAINHREEYEKYADTIYKKYNITKFNTREEFMEHLEPMFLSDTQKRALWAEYRHRHDLILTGQYDEWRQEQFKENYIEGMRKLGATQKEIDILTSISPEQFEQLSNIPNTNKDSIKDKALPELGLFNYDDKSTLYEVRKQLKVLLSRELGIEYEYDDSIKVDKVKALLKVEDRRDVDTTNELTEYWSSIRAFPEYRIKLSKPDKNGNQHYYIPFLGSEYGKNAEIVRDILHEKKIKY